MQQCLPNLWWYLFIIPFAISFSEDIKGKSILIDISDSGKGLPANKLKNVFEPGYTTKERGWGLGLSLAKRIIEEHHGGKIYILNSELGVGTTFRISIPEL